MLPMCGPGHRMVRACILGVTASLCLMSCSDGGSAVPDDTDGVPPTRSVTIDEDPVATSTTETGADRTTITPDPEPTAAPTTARPDQPPADDVIDDQTARIEFARQDIVDRFGYPIAEIEVVAVESIIWPTTAAGCPSTGQEYETRPTPGYRIVLAWADLTFQYHGTDGVELPQLCQFLD